MDCTLTIGTPHSSRPERSAALIIDGRLQRNKHHSATIALALMTVNAMPFPEIINVYLKTRVYVGALGRRNLKEMIHPPVDAGLWLGLARRFPDRPDILERTNCVRRIKDITDYECYRRIIDGCRAAAKALNCELIEVEELWTGTELGALA